MSLLLSGLPSVTKGSTPRLSRYPLVARSTVAFISYGYERWLAAATTVRNGRVPAGCATSCTTTLATSCGSGGVALLFSAKNEAIKVPAA